jgi:Fic family protein
MAHWERVEVPPDYAGSSRAERQGGSYQRYHPDLLAEASNELAPDVLEHAADVSTALARLGGRLRANPLPVLYSTTLRSESISSSWIEGIRATPRDVAVAQISDEAASHTATQIVRNVAAMKDAIAVLGTGPWQHSDLWSIQHELVPWQPEGYRRDQVWIGGSNKLDVDYAAPPGPAVPGYMKDLLGYANTAGDLPVVLAAVIHAQFETIHPFEDGNGRVGRALVHGVFKRAGLIDGGVIPLSTALRNDVPGYVAALTSYRYDGADRRQALSRYVDRFLVYVETATAAAGHFADAATGLHDRWRAVVAGVRSDAALHRAVDLVIENPVVSSRLLAERLELTLRGAEKVIGQLQEARILSPATGKYRRTPLYQADEILTLLSFGAEAGPRTPAPEQLALGDGARTPRALVLRCGEPTTKGPCQNRMVAVGQKCWRHRH